jgi:hypothetical protein
MREGPHQAGHDGGGAHPRTATALQATPGSFRLGVATLTDGPHHSDRRRERRDGGWLARKVDVLPAQGTQLPPCARRWHGQHDVGV